MSEETYGQGDDIGRRKFLAGLIGVVAGAVSAVVGIPAIGYVISPGVKNPNQDEWYTLGPVSALQPGVPTGFPYSRTVQDGWVEATQTGVAYAVVDEAGNVVCLSNQCTHLSCRVTWQGEKNGYFCPCHDGLFGLYGEVLAGPPPRPLDRFQTKVENGQVMILLEA